MSDNIGIIWPILSVSKEMADSVLNIYIDGRLAGHMARRVGIENWPSEAILKWLDYYFGAKQIEKVVTDAHQTWERHQEGTLTEYASDLIKAINDKKKNEI